MLIQPQRDHHAALRVRGPFAREHKPPVHGVRVGVRVGDVEGEGDDVAFAEVAAGVAREDADEGVEGAAEGAVAGLGLRFTVEAPVGCDGGGAGAVGGVEGGGAGVEGVVQVELAHWCSELMLCVACSGRCSVVN